MSKEFGHNLLNSQEIVPAHRASRLTDSARCDDSYHVVRSVVDICAVRPIVVALDRVDIAQAPEDVVRTTPAVDIVLGCSARLDSHYFANLLQ